MQDDALVRAPGRWKSLLALTGAALVGLSACGGGGDGKGSESPATAGSDPATTLYRVVRVGPEGAATGVALNATGQILAFTEAHGTVVLTPVR